MKDLRVLEKRESAGNAEECARVYEDMRRGLYIREDVEAYKDIMMGTALYPVGTDTGAGPPSKLYTVVTDPKGEAMPNHPLSQATQYFIDKYGYPSGLKIFVTLHIPRPARERVIQQIERGEWRGR